MFVLAIAYMVVSFAIAGLCGRRELDERRHFYMYVVYDAVTFAGSVTLLMGILDANVLKLLGYTTVFLLIAGIAGVAHAMQSLWPRDRHLS